MREEEAHHQIEEEGKRAAVDDGLDRHGVLTVAGRRIPSARARRARSPISARRRRSGHRHRHSRPRRRSSTPAIRRSRGGTSPRRRDGSSSPSSSGRGSRPAAGAGQRARRHRVRALDGGGRAAPVSAGLSSIVSIVCAGLGIFYSRRGRQRVDARRDPQASRVWPRPGSSSGSSRWSCRYLRPRSGFSSSCSTQPTTSSGSDFDEDFEGTRPTAIGGPVHPIAVACSREDGGRARRRCWRWGRSAMPAQAAAKPRTPVVMVVLDELPGPLAAGPQRPGRPHPLPELRRARTLVHVVLQRHHRVGRHEVRDPGDPRRAHPDGAAGRPPTAAIRATCSPCCAAGLPAAACTRRPPTCVPTATAGAGSARTTSWPTTASGASATSSRRLEPSSRPTLFYEHVLLPHVPWMFLPSTRRFDRTVLGPISGPEQQRAQRVRPHARAPVLAAPPAAGRRGGHAARRDGRPDEAHRAVGPGAGGGDGRPRRLVPGRAPPTAARSCPVTPGTSPRCRCSSSSRASAAAGSIASLFRTYDVLPTIAAPDRAARCRAAISGRAGRLARPSAAAAGSPCSRGRGSAA